MSHAADAPARCRCGSLSLSPVQAPVSVTFPGRGTMVSSSSSSMRVMHGSPCMAVGQHASGWSPRRHAGCMHGARAHSACAAGGWQRLYLSSSAACHADRHQGCAAAVPARVCRCQSPVSYQLLSRKTRAAGRKLRPSAAGAAAGAPGEGDMASPSSSSLSASASTAASAASGASAAGVPGQQSQQPSARRQWDLLTDRLVATASLPFSILVLPQVFQNVVNLSSGNAAALSIISWEGYISGLLGNTLMCTHFASRGERSAVNVQLIGMISNNVILGQVALAGCMPMPIFLTTAALTALAIALNLGRLHGRIQETDPSAPGAWGVWRLWQLVAGTVGLAIIPQVMCNLLFPGRMGLLPGLLTSAALLITYSGCQLAGPKSQRALLQTVSQLPGSGATLLFALSPLPQLVRNFLEPQSLQGLSIATMLLSLLGNVMMLPRSLFTQDLVWQAGASWGCFTGWGQLLSVYLGTSPITGQRYLGAAPFVAVSATLLAIVVFAHVVNRRVTAGASA